MQLPGTNLALPAACACCIQPPNSPASGNSPLAPPDTLMSSMRASYPQNLSPSEVSDKQPAQSSTSTSGANRERLLVTIFVLFTSFTFFLIQYDRMRTTGASLDDWVHLKLSGSMPAPDQYRIGLPLLMHFLEVHAHIRGNQSLPLIESVCYAFALVLLYRLFRYSPQVENARHSYRLVLLGLFFAAAQFPILWIFPWERPETLPTAFFLAAAVLLVVRRSRMPFFLLCLLVALLSFGQALLRADVPVILGAAIVLSAALAIPFPRPRSQMAILGLLCAAIGGATQLTMQYVVYPTATYSPTTPRFQLMNNLNLFYPPFHIPIFLTALLPLIVSLVLLRRHHLPLDPSDKLVLLACLLYLPVWVSMGLMAEVRIFVPFLFLASPTMAKLWGAYLVNQGDGTLCSSSAALR